MDALISKLSQRDRLSAGEEEALRNAGWRERHYAAGQDIVREGDRPTDSTLLISGLAGRYNIVPEGRRQITALHIAGDFVDLHSFLLHTMDHGVVALTDCVVWAVSHDTIRGWTEQHPHLSRLLWLSTLVDSAIHRRWLVAMGAMSAAAHMAHLFCELKVRLEVVGLTADEGFDMPLTQAQLGEVLGLSLVHVNRVLQELRGTGLLTLRGGRLQILDWDGLRSFAGFNPDYLHLNREPR